MAKSRRLNKQIVVGTAVSLANEVGTWQTLTLTQLAKALDIRVPSLYNHVKGQDGLRRELSLYGVRELLTAVQHAAIGKVAQDALLATAHAYRRFAQSNPGIYELVLQAPDPDDHELQQLSQTFLELLSLLLGTFGLEGDDALHAIRGLRSLLHGFVSLETSQGFKLDLDLDESFTQMIRAYLAGLSVG
ncbi:MAG: WHG domain-containing protein [Chloroflexota bacterium]